MTRIMRMALATRVRRFQYVRAPTRTPATRPATREFIVRSPSRSTDPIAANSASTNDWPSDPDGVIGLHVRLYCRPRGRAVHHRARPRAIVGAHGDPRRVSLREHHVRPDVGAGTHD